MPFISSLLAAFIPMFIYLIFIWQLDRYEREPFAKVLKHFLWGAVGAVFLGIVFSTLLNYSIKLIIPNETSITFLGAVIIAPVTEEIVKALYLFRSFKKNFFDNLTDGLVYGGAIGLGFGMTENLLYFATYNDTFTQWISIVITRSIFSAVMHAIATATVGAFLAKTKFSISSYKYVYPIIGLSIAMFFHATWNFSLTFEFTYYLGIIFMILLIFSFFFVFKSSLKFEQKIIAEELNDEDDFKEYQPAKIESDNPLKEFSRQVMKRSLRKDFVNFATKLAFRKFQARNTEGKQKERYLTEIGLFRQKIREIKQRNLVEMEL